MIIIAFSNHTAKFLPRIFCGTWKHVAPIVPHNDKLLMYQFVKPGRVEKISINMRDINILGRHGWKFIYLNGTVSSNIDTTNIYSCVQLTKHVIGISDWRIQTPGALYRLLR